MSKNIYTIFIFLFGVTGLAHLTPQPPVSIIVVFSIVITFNGQIFNMLNTKRDIDFKIVHLHSVKSE